MALEKIHPWLKSSILHSPFTETYRTNIFLKKQINHNTITCIDIFESRTPNSLNYLTSCLQGGPTRAEQCNENGKHGNNQVRLQVLGLCFLELFKTDGPVLLSTLSSPQSITDDPTRVHFNLSSFTIIVSNSTAYSKICVVLSSP